MGFPTVGLRRYNPLVPDTFFAVRPSVRYAETDQTGVVFQYRVEGPSGKVLVEGETRHVAVDRATGRPTVIPDDLRASLRRNPS